MRHQKARKRMGSSSSHRKAILRNMVTSLFKHGQVETTDAKAKQLKPVAEKMITLAKRGDLHARRQALSFIREKAVTHRLFDEIKDRYTNRPGGYIRIVKKGLRKGDAAPVSVVQLLPAEEGAKKKGRKKTKAPAEPTTKKRASEEAKPKAEEETAPQESAPSQEPVEETNPEKAEAESDDPS
jgi:large subunit ribosomal protein L17